MTYSANDTELCQTFCHFKMKVYDRLSCNNYPRDIYPKGNWTDQTISDNSFTSVLRTVLLSLLPPPPSLSSLSSLSLSAAKLERETKRSGAKQYRSITARRLGFALTLCGPQELILRSRRRWKRGGGEWSWAQTHTHTHTQTHKHTSTHTQTHTHTHKYGERFRGFSEAVMGEGNF